MQSKHQTKALEKYYAFTLIDGTKDYAMTPEDATLYQTENEGIIQTTQTFESLAELEAYKASNPIVTPKKVPCSDDEADNHNKKLSPMDRVNLNKVLQKIQDSRPAEAIDIYHHTTSKSTIAVLCIEFRDRQGKNAWTIKAEHFAQTFSSYASIIKQEDPVVDEMLENMTSVKQRDISKGPEHALVNSWKNKNGKRCEIPVMLLVTTVSIPVQNLSTKEQEQEFLNDSARKLGETMIRLAQEPFFAQCLEEATNSPNLWRLISDEEDDSKNYKAFLRKCKVRVHKCDKLNKHAVLDAAQDMLFWLRDANQEHPKFKEITEGTAVESTANAPSDDHPSATAATFTPNSM